MRWRYVRPGQDGTRQVHPGYHCKKYNNRGEQVGWSRVFRIADPVEYLVTEAVLIDAGAAAKAEEEKARQSTGPARAISNVSGTQGLANATAPVETEQK